MSNSERTSTELRDSKRNKIKSGTKRQEIYTRIEPQTESTNSPIDEELGKLDVGHLEQGAIVAIITGVKETSHLCARAC